MSGDALRDRPFLGLVKNRDLNEVHDPVWIVVWFDPLSEEFRPVRVPADAETPITLEVIAWRDLAAG